MGLAGFLPESDFLAATERGSDALLVGFSPFGTKRGRFALTRAVEALSCDIIRVNSPDEQWYVGGIPETAATPGGFEAGLRAYIAARSYRRVVFYGASKGAYGAVDFGLRAGATAIVATGLELLWGVCGVFRAVASDRAQAGMRQRLREWPALARESGAAIHSFYGIEEVTDLLYARASKRVLDQEAHLVRRCGHAVPIVIEREVGLARFLGAVLEGSGFAGFERECAGLDLARMGRFITGCAVARRRAPRRPGLARGAAPETEAERYVVATALIENGAAAAALPLVRQRAGQDISEPARLLLLARCLFELRELEEAAAIARRLLQDEPGAAVPYSILYRCLLAARKPRRAAAVAYEAYCSNKSNVKMLEEHLKLLLAAKQREKALALLRGELIEARGLRASSYRAVQLSAVARRLGLAISN